MPDKQKLFDSRYEKHGDCPNWIDCVMVAGDSMAPARLCMTGFDCDGTIPDYVKLYGEFYDPTEFYFNSPGVQFIDQPTVVNLVQKMISGGMTQCAIGDELGVSQTTIKKIARKHKLGNSYPGHKGNIIKLFDKGVRDAKKIASSVGCQPGYVYKVASKLGISLNKKELARRAG